MGLQILPLGDRTARRIGLAAALMYALVYLYSVGNIVVAPGVDLVAGAPVPSVVIAGDWSAKIWKPIAPFVWEPIAALYLLPSLAVYLSVPNLAVALLLGVLVGLNVTVAISWAHLVRRVGERSGSLKGLLAAAPGLLTGFACCVPTIVLALGSLAAGFTIAVITVRPYFIPMAVLVLTANLVWGARRLVCRQKLGSC